jgi:hypothetical protein
MPPSAAKYMETKLQPGHRSTVGSDKGAALAGSLATRWQRTGEATMAYLSDTNLRAVLTVLLARLGGDVHITNEELYDAMMPGDGLSERFILDETADGLHVRIPEAPHGESG